MKKYVSKIILMIAVALSFSFATEAQFVVKIRPAAPIVRVRPPMPSPVHVWVGGNYEWRGGQYVYTDGYWARPPQRRDHWVEGHWKNTRRGWTWIPGHWK